MTIKDLRVEKSSKINYDELRKNLEDGLLEHLETNKRKGKRTKNYVWGGRMTSKELVVDNGTL